jgi:hypothetical protein
VAIFSRVEASGLVHLESAKRHDFTVEAALGDRIQSAVVAFLGKHFHIGTTHTPVVGNTLGGVELVDGRVAETGLPALLSANGVVKPRGWPASMAEEMGMALMVCTPPASTTSCVPLITAWAAK